MRDHADHEEVAIVAPARGVTAAAGRVSQILALQRTAGNAAVNRILARGPVPQYGIDDTPSWIKKDEPVKGWDAPLELPMPWDLGPKADPIKWPDPIDFVFILGAEDDKALKSAKSYYSRNVTAPLGRVIAKGEKGFEPTFEGIFKYLQQVHWEIASITIVAHGGADGTMIFPIDSNDVVGKKGGSGKIEPAELHEYVASDRMPKLDPGAITSATRIHLRSCYVGNNEEVVNDIDLAFGHGIGTAIATKVKVAYDSRGLVNEGLTGWWVTSSVPLKSGEVAFALKAKYGGKVKLGPRANTKGPNAGKEMTEDEKWVDMAEKAEHHANKQGLLGHTYVAAAYVEQHSSTSESDETIWTTSDKPYSPTEL